MHSLKQLILCVLLFASLPARAEVAVQEVTGGGVTAWLVEDHHIPALTVMIAFRNAGYTSDTPELSGRAQLLADMLMQGTDRMDDEAFHIALDDHAIQMGTSASRDLFSLTMTTLEENTDTAFSLLADALLRPRLDEARMREAQAQARTALRRMYESPQYRAGMAWNTQVYGTHPYANPPLGTVEGINAVNIAELERFRRTHLTKENMIIAVVGAIDDDTLEKLLDTHFSALPDHFTPDISIPDIAVSPAGSQTSVVMDIPQRIVMLGTQGLPRNDPDFYAAYVLNELLGGMTLTSRLGDVVRKQKGLTYSISSGLDMDLHSQAIKIMFATREEQADEALTATRETIGSLFTRPVTPEEVARSIGYITGSFPLNIDDNGSIANYLIAMQLYDLGMDYLDRRNALFHTVTPEQVQAAAERLLQPEGFHLIEVGPKRDQSSD